MKRRDFIALAGAVAAFPRVAFAQQPKVPRIALLSIPIAPARMVTIRQGLADYGYIDGKTMTLEVFIAPTNNDLPAFAAKAVAGAPDVLITLGTPTTLAAEAATTSIPILFSSNAAVELGLVASLAHPGGNATGMSNTSPDLASKQLGVLIEMLPAARRVCVLNLPADPAIQIVADAVRTAAPALGLDITAIDFVEGKDFIAQFGRVTDAGPQAVFVPSSNYFAANRDTLYGLELTTRLPVMWGSIQQPFYGVLGYASNQAATDHILGGQVDAILKGAKPADMPVEQPTVYDLAVNVTTAKLLGLAIPASILAQATLVME